ncbi:MAG: hypothetical protein AAF823_12325 [Planctomycetota bacterium]
MLKQVLGSCVVACSASYATGAEVVPGSFDYAFEFVGGFVDPANVAFDLYTFDVTNVTDQPIFAFDSLGFSGILDTGREGALWSGAVDTTWADSAFIGGSLAMPGTNVDGGGVLSTAGIADLGNALVGGHATETVAQLAVTPGTVPVFESGEAINSFGQPVGTPPPHWASTSNGDEGSGSVESGSEFAMPPTDRWRTERYQMLMEGDYLAGAFVSPSSYSRASDWSSVSSDDLMPFWSTQLMRNPVVDLWDNATPWPGSVNYAYTHNHIFFEQSRLIDTRYATYGDLRMPEVWAADFGRSVGFVTPEPGAAALVAAGLVGGCLRRSRRAAV